MPDIRPDDVRGKIQQVLDKAIGDPQFLNQFKDDPEGTLKNSGLDAALAHHFATQELNFSEDDVTEFQKCQSNCAYYTGCLITNCNLVNLTS